MPYSIYSIGGDGSKLYGRRHETPDGFYWTTEWVTAFHIPLIPIRTLRVRPVGPKQRSFESTSQEYEVSETHALLTPGQERVAWFVVFAVFFLLLMFIASAFAAVNGSIGALVFVLAVAAIAAGIAYDIRRQMKKVAAQVRQRRASSAARPQPAPDGALPRQEEDARPARAESGKP